MAETKMEILDKVLRSYQLEEASFKGKNVIFDPDGRIVRVEGTLLFEYLCWSAKKDGTTLHNQWLSYYDKKEMK